MLIPFTLPLLDYLFCETGLHNCTIFNIRPRLYHYIMSVKLVSLSCIFDVFKIFISVSFENGTDKRLDLIIFFLI